MRFCGEINSGFYSSLHLYNSNQTLVKVKNFTIKSSSPHLSIYRMLSKQALSVWLGSTLYVNNENDFESNF